MGARPNIHRLKQECGSNHLSQCFKYVFVQEWNENEALIMYVSQKCADLETKIGRRDELIQEAQSFGPFHDVATAGVDCMVQTQQRDRDILAALIGVLDLAREGRGEKEQHVGLMDLKD
ncbi:hypothetical protein CTI12_AA098610 [Artemisia annua]|uniref:Uncharacterized protein n=1 Tax=Artemisia annua TaxID=35608 RepID=A0A2U1PY25_ARTAN|nr:hypothetical protein CTI12_AA098610 [Artemisia annua]